MKNLKQLLIGLAVLGSFSAMLAVTAPNTRIIDNPIIKYSIEDQKDSIVCQVFGTVIDRPETTQAIIIEADKDFRIHKPITVPIVDGKFSITIHDTIPRAYEVIFDDEMKRGSWQLKYFYSGNGAVNLFYHNQEKADENRVVSNIPDNILASKFIEIRNSKIQEEEKRLHTIIKTLYDNNQAYSKEMQELLDKLHNMPKGHERDSIQNIVGRKFKESRENPISRTKCYSEEYLRYENDLTELYRKGDLLKRNFISENPSLFGLLSIKQALMNNGWNDWLDVTAYEDIFENIYKNKYQHHPYIEEIIEMMEARNVKVGNKYPDFKVTREDGSYEKISSLVKGNVAVIDLWASWCGPCRRHSKELIPVYEKYKDKGFKVIAVARESDDCNAMNEAMEKDGYPWESFVDLNDQDKVWRINSAGNGGGKIILVNSDGVIVGTDMPIQEIKEFLEKTYGE